MAFGSVGFSTTDFSLPSVKIVLLGKNASENSQVGNLIFGTDAFKSEAPPDVGEKVAGRLKDRHVIVINSPQLLQKNISDHQITQAVRECVNLSDPGPRVFILVLQHNDFTEEDLRRVKHVLKEFSEEAIKHTIVFTTDEKKHRAKRASVKVNKFIQQLTAVCGGGHLQVKDKRKICSQILKTVTNTLKRRYSETVKETTKTGLSDDTEDSGSVDSDLLKSHKVKREERSSSPQIPNPFSRRVQSPDVVRPNMSTLNLVVCGSDGALKSSISELILQQTDRRSDVELHDRLINLLELPALIGLSEEEVMRQTLHCVSLCHPGVHAFLLIIPVGPLTNDNKAEIEKIQKIFDSEMHFMVIFTSEMRISERVIKSVKPIVDSQSLCGGRYKVIGLKELVNSRQIPELLDYIANMKTRPYSAQMYVRAQENIVRQELEEQHKKELKEKEDEIKELKQRFQSERAEDKQDDLEHLRIVLIGRTGNGKSATGNTILGREEFLSELSSDSVTTVCMKGVGEVEGRSVAVVDTPGLFDTSLPNDQVVEEIIKCISLSSPGPHVFAIVLSVGRFTKEEADTVDLIKKIFGPKAAQFSIVLFTRGDDLGSKSIEDHVKRSNNAELKKLIRDYGDRFLVFNNREKQDKTQVIQLLNMIEEVKNTNEGRYFSNSMFEEAEMSIKKRMEEIMKEREREIQTQHEKLRVKYETEKEELKKRLEEDKRKADEERIQRENEFRQKEKKFKQKEKTEQKKREIENQKRSKEEKQQRAKYHREMKEMKREIENQRLQFENQQKEREEEEDRKREEKYRQDQEKMKHENECAMAKLKKKQQEETKKRDLVEKRRNVKEEKERQRWERKIKEAENDRKEILEEVKRQQREWEDKNKRHMREQEEEERKINEKHEKQLREKQEELEKIRERFEREREEERQKIEDEKQKQRREKEEKEREYEIKKQEMERHYEQLERKRKEEWERRKREDDERREEERKGWERKIEDLKQEREKEIKKREKVEKERKEREEKEKERDEMKKEYEEKIRAMKKKHKDEARKQAEELNDLRDGKEELTQKLKEDNKQCELLEKVFQHLKDEKSEEVENLKKEIEDFKRRQCSIM